MTGGSYIVVTNHKKCWLWVLAPPLSNFVRFGEPSPHGFVIKRWDVSCYDSDQVPHRLSNPPTHALYALGACMSVPLVLIAVANQRWFSWLGRWSFFLVQVCLCFLSLSLVLPSSFFNFILRAAWMLVLGSWFLSWRRRRKKEVEKGLWFLRAGTRDLQTRFHHRIRVFKTWFASKIESNKLKMLVS